MKNGRPRRSARLDLFLEPAFGGAYLQLAFTQLWLAAQSPCTLHWGASSICPMQKPIWHTGICTHPPQQSAATLQVERHTAFTHSWPTAHSPLDTHCAFLRQSGEHR